MLLKITESLQQYMNKFYLINHPDRFIQKYITNVESFMNLINLINKSLTHEIQLNYGGGLQYLILIRKKFVGFLLQTLLLHLIARTTNTQDRVAFHDISTDFILKIFQCTSDQ